MKIKILFILSFFIIPGLQVQTKENYERAGVFFHYDYNLHNPNFSKLPGVPNCCPHFSEGSGSGLSAGLLYEWPFASSLILSLRTGYYNYSGKLEDKDYTTVLVDDQLTEGEFRHIIDNSISTIGLEALLGAEIADNFFLYFGFNFGFYISGSFEQWEQLYKPEYSGVFVDSRKRTRNDTTGSIPGMKSLAYSLEFGATYEFYLNKERTLIAAPEVFYTLGMNDILEFLPWTVNTLRIGAAFKYTWSKPPEIREEYRQEMDVDTVRVLSKDIERDKYLMGVAQLNDTKKELIDNIRYITEYYSRMDTLLLVDRSKPAAGIKEYKVHSYGKEAETNRIYINRQFVTQAFPLLPVVYFERNSPDIPQRYIKPVNIDNYDVLDLEANPVNFHQNILNIIGSRLKAYPDATIRIEGYADAATEESDCGLAKKRAEAVKDYLVSTWNIAQDRIAIVTGKKKCSPDDYTRTPNEYGYSENRRVRINSEDKRILAPLDKQRYLETLTISPLVLAHDIEAENENDIAEWFITANQGGNIQVFSDAGLGRPGLIQHNITESMANKLVSGAPLDFNLRIKYKNGEVSTTGFSIPVKKDTSDVEVERLSLAIFNVSGNTLREVDKKSIEKFLSELKPTDTVSVAGYTDMLGDPDENTALSQRRADIVCSEINSIFREKNDISIIRCKGVAFSFKPPQINSYELPEERFLSRTVQIEIRRRWR